MIPPVVVLSGWAMPVSVLKPLMDKLANHVTVTGLSLPGINDFVQYDKPVRSEALFQTDHVGCGQKSDPNDELVTWPMLARYLDNYLPEYPAVLVGWSFGGTLVIRYAASHPEKVAGVVTMATNPSFVRCKQWPSAMNPPVFEHFCEQFVQNPTSTLKRFARMCSEGSQFPLQIAHVIKQVWQQTQLDKSLLDRLQRFLGMADVTASLASLRCPVSHLLGCNDVLVPAEVNKFIKQNYPEHHVSLTRGGHAFCMENPQWAAAQVLSLCSR
ncbi:Pimeloyl-[acyl-carrier protein] methyl ester esterase [invertebrate metagenome]|uniref:Pimeloyl-[acyl-carrier protein] methyl ester esterase n=1 Tax=invertebrate metagenome TaxID=1711999 RepID=A0A2H9T9L3_9ZZZZ